MPTEVPSFSGNNSCLDVSEVENKWIIDTGAIDHMVCSISHLSTITGLINASVKLPNGDKALVTHLGTVRLSEKLVLTNVLCILHSNAI